MADPIYMTTPDDVVPDDEAPRKRGGRPRIYANDEERREARNARRRAAAGDAGPKPLGPRKRGGQALAKKLTTAIQFVGGIAAVREPFDGAVLTAAAPKLGETYAAVLERHPKALAYLNALESGGVYGAAVLATLTVALPILAHHRMLPEVLTPAAVLLSPVEMGIPVSMNGAGHPAGE